jgi:hypothetical protein
LAFSEESTRPRAHLVNYACEPTIGWRGVQVLLGGVVLPRDFGEVEATVVAVLNNAACGVDQFDELAKVVVAQL